MENLDLTTLGVKEMDETQIQEVNGGFILWGLAITYLVQNRSDLAQGFSDGWNDGHCIN